MTPHFSPRIRNTVLAMPLWTPALVAMEDELSLVLRTDNLRSFQKPLPITVRVVSWRSREGTWVVCVAFRVMEDPKNPVEGAAYLNPQQAEDWEHLQRLSRQTRVPFVFCDKTLLEAVGKAVPWTTPQQQEVRALVERIGFPGEGDGTFDPDFQRAKDAFQAQFSVRDLLA